MSMEAYDILVIILASALAVLLLLAIIFAVYLIQILSQLKRLTRRAEDVMHNVEVAGESVRRTAESISLTRLLANIVDTVAKRRK